MKRIDFTKNVIVTNLKKNWYFPISALAFFCLNLNVVSFSGYLTASFSMLGYLIGLLIAFLISLIIASQLTSIWDLVKKNHIYYQITSILTAVGICWGEQAQFYAVWSRSSEVQALEAMLPVSVDIPGWASVFGAVAAFFFVYACVLVFWKELVRIIADTGIFKDAKVGEMIVYVVFILATLVFITVIFAQTDAFYGTEYRSDVIYSSDSSVMVKDNAYLMLTHRANNIKQPLFAVFAAPFIGIPVLIGKLFGVSPPVQAMLMNYIQILMLFAANYMLTKMMELTPLKRSCFMLLTCCTYTYLLSVLMMEQYIVTYFWLVFCLYLICERGRPDRIALWGACGTMITSMVILPFTSDKSPLRNFREWFADVLKSGFEFVAIMLIFCRFDILFTSIPQIRNQMRYTGKAVPLMDRIFQYTAFIKNCFLAPDAGVGSFGGHIAWWLSPATKINILGVGILLLVIFSAVLNRNKKSSLIAAGWVVFSLIILLCVGWGTAENGQILYSLYFAWAFFVLVFQFVEKIECRLNVKFLIPVITAGFMMFLAVNNIPAIMEVVKFAITHFPV